MRILHVCKYFFPRITGVTAYVENLSREQLARGHAVGVASFGEPSGAPELPGIELFRAPAGEARELVGRIAGFRPDVIHAHSIWETTDIAVRAAKEAGCPYVITTHGTWQFLKYTPAFKRVTDRLRLGLWRRHAVWPRLLRGAGAVIALNAREEADARAAHVAHGCIHRIPNAVDTAAFSPASPGGKEKARDRLGWPPGLTALFVGNMQEQKGVFTLLQAARMAGSAALSRWVFCGDGPDREAAKAEARAFGLSDRALFLGRVPREDMPGLYQAADMAVLPSREEPFATVFLEAMASGLPCVGCAGGGTAEIISDCETGFVVPPADAPALSKAVRWLADHPEGAASMGRAGRLKVEREFAWPRVAGRIERAYRAAAGLLLVLRALAVAHAALAARVIPLDMLTMIDPATGESVPEPDVTPGLSDWRVTNPAWDGHTAHLLLAPGESAALQLMVLTAPGERLKNIRIRVDLPGGVKWRAWRAWHIWGIPEVAVPLGGDNPPFDIPSAIPAEREAAEGLRVWSMVVEVTCPREALPGRLNGEARVVWEGGEVRIPLIVAVARFAMPRRPSFVVEMNSYGDFLRRLPAAKEALPAVFALFREFGCTFTLVPYRQNGTPVLEFLEPIARPDGTLDFSAFDAALSGFFDGSAFADHEPVSRFILPLRTNWPASPGDPEFTARNAAARKYFIRHITEKGWGATRFEEFHNENPEAGAKVKGRLDEPLSAADLACHEPFLRFREAACGQSANSRGQTGQSVPGASAQTGGQSPCPLRYRMDISRWQPLRGDLTRVAHAVTDWSLSADPAFLTDEAVDFFRNLGGESILAYGELPGFAARGKPVPWSVFPARLVKLSQKGVDGFAQWMADRWQDKPLAGIPAGLAVLFQANANGARDFMWPGSPLGVEGPMPSYRLFAVREGLNLLTYYHLVLKHRPELADALRKRLSEADCAARIAGAKAWFAALAAKGEDYAPHP